MDDGGVLFGRHRLLRWRFLPPTAPPCRPDLDQFGRNIGPAIVSPPRADTTENLAAGGMKEIGLLRLLKFPIPLVLERDPLLGAQHTRAPQSAALQIIAGI